MRSLLVALATGLLSLSPIAAQEIPATAPVVKFNGARFAPPLGGLKLTAPPAIPSTKLGNPIRPAWGAAMMTAKAQPRGCAVPLLRVTPTDGRDSMGHVAPRADVDAHMRLIGALPA